MRLLSVLGASQALTDHLVRHPDQWHDLTDPTLGSTRPAAYAVRAALADRRRRRPGRRGARRDAARYGEALDALRVAHRRILLRLASRDLAHHVGVDDVAAELSDLAAGTLDAALAVARAQVGEEAATVRLAVIAMGKCGGHELNYVSDVDVIFVHEPVDGAAEAVATRVATQLASRLMRACSDHTAEGTIWPVDAALRPEGKAGPLVRTMAGMRAYYERWAKTWEFQALLKARPVAGDLRLGREFVEMVSPLVWGVAGRDGFVADVQAMRRRVVETIPVREADRQLKLGVGRAARRRVRRPAAPARARQRRRVAARAGHPQRAVGADGGGYVGRVDGEEMHQAYAFLRTLEHRIQLYQLRRTHVVPSDEAALRRVAPRDGLRQGPRGRARGRLAGLAPRGTATAREAVLPPAAHGRGPDVGHHRRRLRAVVRGGRVAAGGARLRRPQGRPAAPGGAHQRRHPDRQHPAGADAGDARVVRRLARPRRGPVRVPAAQRVTGLDPLVPRHAARRGPRRRAPGPGAGAPRASRPP